MFDEGGPPSAPSFSQVCMSQPQVKTVTDVSSNRKLISRKNKPSPHKSGKIIEKENDQMIDSRADADGFITVKKKQQRKRIVGTRMQGGTVLKSAPRTADIYVGNCDVDISPESLQQYIEEEVKIKVKKCEKLITRYDNYASFKVTLFINDREKLLSSDVWPSGIVCRKYYSPRNNHQ